VVGGILIYILLCIAISVESSRLSKLERKWELEELARAGPEDRDGKLALVFFNYGVELEAEGGTMAMVMPLH